RPRPRPALAQGADHRVHLGHHHCNGHAAPDREPRRRLLMAQLRPSNTAWSTAQERVFDVTQYGALGDGATDATAAIQAAAAAAAAAGGGTVFIPAGTFIV